MRARSYYSAVAEAARTDGQSDQVDVSTKEEKECENEVDSNGNALSGECE